MKELSVEEKAKRYDEAIGKANDILKGYNPKEGSKATINYIFPELKESEDEKVRKHIIEVIKNHFSGEDADKCIAWLEKLKVFTEHGDGLYYFGNNGFTYVGSPIWDNDSWLEKQEPKKHIDDLTQQEAMDIAVAKCFEQSEQKHVLDIEIPFGAKDSELQEATYLIPEGFHAEIEGDKVVIKKGKQKSAWSKEDEWKFSDILALLRGGENCHYNTPDLFDWFKSLKNRISCCLVGSTIW